MKKILILLIILTASLNISAGRYAGDFMAIGSGVRSLGMGGAFSAIADDGSAIYWNTSGIAQLRKTEIGISRAFLYQGLASYDTFNLCQPLPNEVTIGFNWTRLTIKDIPIFKEEYLIGTNVDQRSLDPTLHLPGIPDGQFTSTDDLFQFAFAKHVHYNLNMGWLFFELPFDLYFGGNIKYVKRKMLNIVATGTGFDFSFITKTDLATLLDVEYLGTISFGLNFQDVGGTVISWDKESQHEDEILFNNKLGTAVYQPLNFIDTILILSHDVDYVYEKTHHFGLESIYKDRISFRLGYYDKNFSTGLSFKIYEFTVDYAFLTNALGNTNRVGIRFNF